MIQYQTGAVGVLQAGPRPRAATGLLAVGFILHIIGVAAPFWWKITSNLYGGIWILCAKSDQGDVDCDSYYANDLFNVASWLRAVEGFAIMTTLPAIVALAMTISFLRRKTVNLLYVAGCSAAAAGFLGLLTIIIFGAKRNDKIFSNTTGSTPHRDLSWAFGLDCAAAIIFIVACGILVAEIISIRSR